MLRFNFCIYYIGQGLNKSHPYIFPILESVLNNDQAKFKKEFNSIISHSLKLYAKSFSFRSNYHCLDQQIINFACLTNFVALKGRLLKKEQMLSGTMDDIFSNLYLALAVEYYYNNTQVSRKLTDYIIQRLMNENQYSINKVIDNFGSERFLLQHLKSNITDITYDKEREIFDEIINNKEIIEEIGKNIVTKNNILDDLNEANNISKDTSRYEFLNDRIIIVGEYYNN